MSIEEANNTVVIGGGQAGLAAGYYLAQRGNNYLVMYENSRTGETWRRHWDSLRLFTVNQISD